MKIAILSQWYYPEPGGAVVPSVLARSLAQRGHEVQVLTGFPNYPSGRLAPGYQMERRLDERDTNNVNIRRVALYPDHGKSALRRGTNYLSFALSASASGSSLLRKSDVVWVYNSPVTIALPSMLASAVGGPPHLMHVMDLWPESMFLGGFGVGRSQKLISRLIGTWCDITYKSASAIACTSKGIANVLSDRGVPNEKLFHIPVWTDESIYFERPYAKELADFLGVKEKFVVLYAGTLGSAQGLSGLLEVCQRLQDLPHVQVLIAGSGTGERDLRNLASSMKISNIQFLGQWPTEDMGRLISISDVNLVSLKADLLSTITIPSKLVSILASGRPVIAWADGELADIVNESGAGLIAKAGDVNELEHAIRQMCSGGESYIRRFGKMGRIYYDQRLSLETGVDSVERVLSQIA
jgi:glycosyltransferase involved in cell wall biosynthesis